RLQIKPAPLALHVRSVRSADVGAFLPFEPEPAQVLEHLLGIPGLAAIRIEILVAKNERATGGAGALLSRPKGERMPQVQRAAGCGSDATAITFRHVCPRFDRAARSNPRHGSGERGKI